MTIVCLNRLKLVVQLMWMIVIDNIQHLNEISHCKSSVFTFYFVLFSFDGSFDDRVADTTKGSWFRFQHDEFNWKKQWSAEFVKQSTWYWTLQGVISLLTVPGNCLVIFLILTRRYLLFFISQQTGISCNNVVLLWLSCYFYQQYMHDGIW